MTTIFATEIPWLGPFGALADQLRPHVLAYTASAVLLALALIVYLSALRVHKTVTLSRGIEPRASTTSDVLAVALCASVIAVMGWSMLSMPSQASEARGAVIEKITHDPRFSEFAEPLEEMGDYLLTPGEYGVEGTGCDITVTDSAYGSWEGTIRCGPRSPSE